MLPQFKGFLDDAKKAAARVAKSAQRSFDIGYMGSVNGDARDSDTKTGLNSGQSSTYGTAKPGGSNTKQ